MRLEEALRRSNKAVQTIWTQNPDPKVLPGLVIDPSMEYNIEIMVARVDMNEDYTITYKLVDKRKKCKG